MYLFTSTVAPPTDSVIWAAHNCCSGMQFRRPRGISLPNSTWGALIVIIPGWSRSRIAGAPLGLSWLISDILREIPAVFREQYKLSSASMSGLMRPVACLLLPVEPCIGTWDRQPKGLPCHTEKDACFLFRSSCQQERDFESEAVLYMDSSGCAQNLTRIRRS